MNQLGLTLARNNAYINNAQNLSKIGGNIGGSVFSGLFGGLLGLANAGIQRRWQEEANKQMAELNYKYGEKAADNAMRRGIAMYNAIYSPEARVKQLQDAGLSVGLMYGNGGAGGTGELRGPQGGGAGGQRMQVMAPMEGAQLALLGSQIKLNEAQANKSNAEAESTRGEEGTIGAAQVQNYMADTDNKRALRQLTEANEALARAQARAQEINNNMSEDAYDFKLQQIEYEMLTQAEELQNLILSNAIKGASKEAQIEQYWANLEKTYAEALYNRSGAAVNKQQAGKIIAEVQKIWAETDYMKELPELKREQISAMLTNAGVSAEAAIDSSLIGSVGNIVASFGRFFKWGKGRSFGQWMQKRPATVTATEWYN